MRRRVWPPRKPIVLRLAELTGLAVALVTMVFARKTPRGAELEVC